MHQRSNLIRPMITKILIFNGKEPLAHNSAHIDIKVRQLGCRAQITAFQADIGSPNERNDGKYLQGVNTRHILIRCDST